MPTDLQQYNVTGPDGQKHVIQGPPGASDEDVIAQAKQLFGGGEQTDLNGLFAHDTGGTDMRGAGEVLSDQIGHFLNGAAGAVTGIPDSITELAGGLHEALTGKGTARLQSTLRNTLAGIGDVIVTPTQEAAAYLAPNSVKAPSRETMEGAAENAGNLAGSAAIGEGLKLGVKGVRSIPGTPEGLQALAEKAKAYRQDNPVNVHTVKLNEPGTYVKPVMNAGASLVEKAANALAKSKAEKLGRTPYGEAATDESRRMSSIQNNPPAAAEEPYTPPPAEQPGVSTANQEFLNDLRRQSGIDTTPDPGDMRQPASPSQPIDGATPELDRMREDIEQSKEPVSYRTIPPPANPIDPGTTLSNVYPETGADSRAVSSPSQPIEANSPALTRMQEDIEQSKQPVSYRTIPPPANPVEMPNPPQETAAPTGSANGRQISMAHEAIIKDGASANLARQAKIARLLNPLDQTGKPIPGAGLLDVLPELRGVPPGENFNTRLYNGYDKIGHQLNAVEKSIPDATQVPTGDAVKQLDALEQKYTDTNQPLAIKAIDKVRSFLKERPSMDWKSFIEAKRSFFNEIKLNSNVGTEAYQIFKKMSNDVSPELGKLNQQYYVAKSAIEHAGIDARTGVKLRPLGKPAKAPLGASSAKGFRMPL